MGSNKAIDAQYQAINITNAELISVYLYNRPPKQHKNLHRRGFIRNYTRKFKIQREAT